MHFTPLLVHSRLQINSNSAQPHHYSSLASNFSLLRFCVYNKREMDLQAVLAEDEEGVECQHFERVRVP
jgi:hypothetical protein